MKNILHYEIDQNFFKYVNQHYRTDMLKWKKGDFFLTSSEIYKSIKTSSYIYDIEIH